MLWAEDPVGAGLVTSLARPGGNITGLSLTAGPEFSAKQLEILNEIVPKLSRVAIFRQTGRSGAYTAAFESAARKLGLTILFTDVRTPNDIEGAFATLTRSRPGALLVLGGSVAGRAERNSEAYSEARFTSSRSSDGPSNFRFRRRRAATQNHRRQPIRPGLRDA
jgi:ABC transporter substrate binding protein